MKFLNLELNNFLSVGSAKINLKDRGLVLIEGKNMDDPSAKSNGAGKSSIVDGLCFCLYGKTARGVSGDAVINRRAKKKCSTSVTIEADDGQIYTITRYRKNPDSGLTVTSNGNDISKGTMAETQQFIESLIGCPYDVFIAVVYAGQDAMPDLPNMSDRQLKELIEKIIGVERLSQSYVIALAKVNEASAKLSEAQMRFSQAENLMDYTKRNLEQVAALSEGWLSERQEELRKLQNEVDHCSNQSNLLMVEQNKTYAEYSPLLAQENEVEAQIIGYEEQQKQCSQLMQLVYVAQREYDNLVELRNRVRSEAMSLGNEIEHIDQRVGQRCSECGKPIETADIAEHKEALVNKLRLKVEEFKSYDPKVLELERNLQEATKNHKEAQEGLLSLVELQQTMRTINAGKTAINNIKMKVDRANTDLIYAKDKVNLKNEEIARGNPYKTQIARINEELKKQESDYQSIKKEVLEAEKAVLITQKVRDVFGSGGVRQHILETITPILNERTDRYLDILSDGKLKAIWSTLTTNKSGVVKEKFNIEVTNSVGGGSFESLSGGEKRKVRLACCLALQELVASRASKPIDLFIADEVDHALDESGVERLIGVLNEKARVCKTLLVISHNPLRNWIDEYITVVKEGGVSTVEEY